MARWEPNAAERLASAALALYRERGYEETSVADIAERAGLTERTFFRHFTDKKEVLFGGSQALLELLTSHIAAAPAGSAPMALVAAALEATAPLFDERRPYARVRQDVITSHAALYERELIKLASLAAAMAEALHKRGVPDPAAVLAAETGITVFKLAFEQWVRDEKKRSLAQHIREAHQALLAVTADAPKRAAAKKRAVRR